MVGTDPHRPELEHPDELAPASHPLLGVEDGPSTRELRANPADDHERQKNQEEDDSEQDIKGALDRTLRPGEVRLIEMQERQVSSHSHTHAGARHIADRWCDQQIDPWPLKSPRQPLDHPLAERWRARDRHCVGVLKCDAGHDLIEPCIEPCIINISGRLVDNINDGEAGYRVAVEHVDDLRLRGLCANDNRAVQEVAVPALVPQPSAQCPSDDEEKGEADNERDDNESAR